MKDRRLSKAMKAISREVDDLDEAPYLVGGERMAREAKRNIKRAQRRVDAALIEMGLEEYMYDDIDRMDTLSVPSFFDE